MSPEQKQGVAFRLPAAISWGACFIALGFAVRVVALATERDLTLTNHTNQLAAVAAQCEKRDIETNARMEKLAEEMRREVRKVVETQARTETLGAANSKALERVDDKIDVILQRLPRQ